MKQIEMILPLLILHGQVTGLLSQRELPSIEIVRSGWDCNLHYCYYRHKDLLGCLELKKKAIPGKQKEKRARKLDLVS